LHGALLNVGLSAQRLCFLISEPKRHRYHR
jgi:hypothetical protein